VHAILFAVFLAPTLASAAAAQHATHRLVAGDGVFLLDGKPFQIVSGEMHYSRIPRAYWHDRLRKARSMGLNTVSTYVFWNYHELTPGHYDFGGQGDIAAYVRAAQEEGLYAILRPGPYVCAEWDLGGYPAWLLADTAIVLRSTDPNFTRPAERWLDRLGKELAPLLATRGGPIIAVQVENEYGSFDDDKNYLQWQLAALRWMLSRGYSVNMYMLHGGTSFGFMNGANGSPGAHDYWPQTTSYDYDAALDESGRPTPKYYEFRDVIARHVAGDSLIPVPESPPPIGISAFALDEVAPLSSTLGAGVKVERPKSMEQLGQSYGFILYRTHLSSGSGGVQELRLVEVRDYARVYLNDSLAGTLDRRLGQSDLALRIPRSGATLDILVENMGRINFTTALRDERKGITHAVMLDGRELTGWTVFTLPMTSFRGVEFHHDEAGAARGPAFYRGTFTVDHPGNTFLDMRGWGKGTVWINGHHLGRFWNIGPQQTLYVPGPWLVPGSNEVIVFDLDVPERRTLAGLSHPILDDLQP
jgi:beta-galactosidase GanA